MAFSSHDLTPTQRQILALLPATPDELAFELYHRLTRYERAVVYAHISLLRQRLPDSARIISRRRPLDERHDSCRIVYELERQVMLHGELEDHPG